MVKNSFRRHRNRHSRTNSSFSGNALPPVCEGSHRRRPSSYTQDHRFVVCSGKLYVDGLQLSSLSLFSDLFKQHKIAYSFKVVPIWQSTENLVVITNSLIYSYVTGKNRLYDMSSRRREAGFLAV